MNRNSSDLKTTVYYDGLCHLCSREIEHYKGMKGSENLLFVDITSMSFDATKEELDPQEIHRNMHVRGKDGELKVGVNAFIAIWKELPSLNFLVPIARFKPINMVLKIFYALFAQVRPLLPRKSCEDSPYCELHQK